MSLAEHVRRSIPVRAVPPLARARAWWTLRDDEQRRQARAHMEFLLGTSRPEAEIERATTAFVRFYLQRPELHRHPRVLHAQEVVGTAHLVEAAARGRGVVLHFLHHGLFEGSLASLGRQGLLEELVGEADLVRDDLTGSRLVFSRMLRSAVPMHSTEIGADAIVELVRAGRTVGLASDRPGRTPVTFCGRRVWSASGTARVSVRADAPVVVMTAERTPSGRVIGRIVGPGVEPGDFGSPADLLQHLMTLHEPSVLRWPEAYVFPAHCYGTEPTPLPAHATGQ